MTTCAPGSALRWARSEAKYDVSIVADRIIEAADAERPRRRYAAGRRARQVALLRRFVPAEAFDNSLREQSGL